MQYLTATHNKSLDASGGSVFRILNDPAEGALNRAAASTQPLGDLTCTLRRIYMTAINAEYRVLPNDPNYQQVEVTKYEKDNIKGLGGGFGCLTWGGLFLASYLLIGFVAVAAVGNGSILPLAFIAGIVIASVGVAVITSTIRRNRIERLEREKNENARNAELNRVTSEASSLTSRVAHNYQDSTQLT